ncbi:MAG: Crp/Fnr family transcriptional regulator [Mycobacteriaceae bacterium]|nr:Crp/Fnr family transcriptional regulator [Mycobacteriaceae bacterium]
MSAVTPSEQLPREEWDWPESSLLGGLPASARRALLALGATARYPAGRVLIREADDTTFVLILLRGMVKATAITQDGREALLAVRMGGDLVGELAGLDGKPRSATVTACGAVAARLVTRNDLRDCLRRDPVIALAINAAIVGKLRMANVRRVEFVGCDAPTRLARVLHQIAMTYGERLGNRAVVRWPITQPELATLSGAAEPTVQKALRALRESGVVSTGYRSITIENVSSLHRLAFE